MKSVEPVRRQELALLQHANLRMQILVDGNATQQVEVVEKLSGA